MSSNVEKYSTVIVGYVLKIYLFQLAAILLVAIVLKSFMNVFHLIIGRGQFLWELHLPGILCQTMLLLLKLWRVLGGPFVVA